MTEPFACEIKNIKKEYFENKVLKGVSLSIRKGEIHAIVGENGAGKSTLMNILFGMPVIQSTGGYIGEIIIEGQKVEIKSPNSALKYGIGMVHQEFMLLPGFTITENIKLNRETLFESLLSKIFGPRLKTLDVPSMRSDAKRALNSLGMTIDDWLPVAGMPVGYMQFIEIAREIDKENLKLLIFDEPTAVLTESEADKLLEAMVKIAKTGVAILFITHRLDEVMKVADNITVLRDGHLIETLPKPEATITKIAELMVGRKVERIVNKSYDFESEDIESKTIMSIKNLNVLMPGEVVRNFNFDIKKGEILGIGGLAGQGKIGIANGIMGLYRSSGKITIDGATLTLNNPQKAISSGLAFVSEDRRGVGLLLDTSIELNIVMTSMQIQSNFLKPFLSIKQIKMKNDQEITLYAEKMIKDLDIRCLGTKQTTRRLSGGNQQKVCIARALTLNPKILLVSEPTRGIDVGAKKLVLDLLVKLNTELGMTIIITSSELTELRSICDRIAIIYEGMLEGVLRPYDPDVDFGLMMAGEHGALRKELIQ